MSRSSWRPPARLVQILGLGSLLLLGVFLRDFSIRPFQVVLTISTALLVQAVGVRAVGLRNVPPWSAIITGLGLSLLLRADSYWVHPLAAAVAIGAKFLIRVGEKHLFNPANLGVMAALIALPGTWVSPGQWGQEFIYAGWFLMIGGLVVQRARRIDIAWTFLGAYLGLLAIRVLWLGQRPEIWLHALQNGSLLLFAFFMISDPMTIPNHPTGRRLHALLVAVFALVWQYAFFRTNGLLWALLLLSPLVPLWDRFWPASKFTWSDTPHRKEYEMPHAPSHPEPLPSPAPLMGAARMARRLAPLAALFVITLLGAASPRDARAFCGFFVAKADASLYNEASQVALVRDGNRTVVSMLNDYKGDLKEFALVVPVPAVLEQGQVHVADPTLFDHLDAYSAPRLVEYFDEDPCEVARYERMAAAPMASGNMAKSSTRELDDRLGVTIEAKFTVGEYDILILSARESDGLETWLTTNGYRIPPGANRALQPYIRQGLKFFVAKVNLKEHAKTGNTYLRPLQFAYESDRFMLPIRLGMINAKGPQDLILYVLTREGRVETTNYRTVRVPSDSEVPVYVKETFADFYRALFTRAAEKEGMRAVFTEYVWNMGWCDPCAADPLSPDELRQLGVFWLEGDDRPGPVGKPWMPGIRSAPAGPIPVMLTRLHVRYAKDTFPEDLVFQQTKDQENFQGRYILRHPWTGDPGQCPAAREYVKSLRKRQEQEAQTLASLTGWDITNIRRKMNLKPEDPGSGEAKWWEKLWKN